MKESDRNLGLAGTIAATFVHSKLTVLFILASILLGVVAVVVLPREEEPQIKVPIVDVFVSLPGFSAKEVEERAIRPMEKLLWEIPGVEYLYSTSRQGEGMAIVRFKVGEDVERSLVKLHQKLESNYDRIPPGVSVPLIKAHSIDDVPILALTFHSQRYDHLTLRRLAAQIDDAVKQVPLVAETNIIGGARRSIRVLFHAEKLALHGLTPSSVAQMLRLANREFSSGALTEQNKEVLIESGGFLSGAEDVGNVVVGVSGQKPIFLREVADVRDDADELSQYVFFGDRVQTEDPAVTLTLAKRPGANAVDVAREVLQKVETLRGVIIPSDVEMTVTRNYGETAAEKSNELLFHMGIAILSVTALIWFVLGARESFVVATAIPTTLALTLLTFFLLGFTLNRITLFALIFSIGILVDDAIVVVENIVRHLRLTNAREGGVTERAIAAVSEVGNPTILATFAVIAAVLPMAFVGGLMGPYMRPIPVGSSAAMMFSLLVAFIVTPWAAVRILRHDQQKQHQENSEDWLTVKYRMIMQRLIEEQRFRRRFLFSIVALLFASMALVGFGWVKVKMLPFDNKSEFQVILNMPEGSSLEKTAMVAKEIAAQVLLAPEVKNYQLYIGTAAPMNFNGLVRHYFLRQGAPSADIQVNLVPKSERALQSHDIVRRIRPGVEKIASAYNARIALTEVPPGPPVLQTIVAEVYGEDDTMRLALARRVRDIMKNTAGVVDVDWYVESPRAKVRFAIDKEKAALHGISAETISEVLRTGVQGLKVDILHSPREKEDMNIIMQLPRSGRSTIEDLLSLRVRSGDANFLAEPERRSELAPLIPLGELVHVERVSSPRSIYHKNLHPVTYVTADVAGVVESPVYALMKMKSALKKIDAKEFGGSSSMLKVYNLHLPNSDLEPAMKWDGEWHITLEVFRDLGAAFAVVLVLIYVLMVGWFQSFTIPFVVMAAIPFSLIGILPAHGLLGAFFTATSMIGFMAGAGIVVRNSIILVDFIQLRLSEGMNLSDAVIDAGAVRFRPMLLTALAVIVGAAVLLFDPIFQGLAISLMAGEVASLLVSRMAVPVLYYMLANRNSRAVAAV